jgi:predicted O-methyltransferase YrrM
MPSPIDTIPQTTQDFAVFKELLYHLIIANKYVKVLETGTDVGDSTRIFSTALQATQGQLVTVDQKPPVNNWPSTWPIKNIQFVQADSRQLKVNQELDLIFLDAHQDGTDAYQHVSTELKQLGVWVKIGGKIVLDDWYHGTFGEGIRKATEEFARLHQVAWTVYPHGHGLAVVEVSHLLPRT